MAIRFKFGKDKSEVIREPEPEAETGSVISGRDGRYINNRQPQPMMQQQPQMQPTRMEQPIYRQPPQELPPYPQQAQAAAQAQQPQQQEPTPEQKILMQKYLDFVKESGIYNLDDFRNLFQAEICNLLFGIMQELKKINKKLQ